MDIFIAKLEKLMEESGIKNLMELSKKSGIPYTTLTGMYSRGTGDVRRATLIKLSKFFNCTIDYLANDEISADNTKMTVKSKNSIETRNVILFMMGGKGQRCDRNLPKQFYLINNKPIFAYILEDLNAVDSIDDIVIVTHPDYLEYTQEWVEKTFVKKVYCVLPPENTRSQSVLLGLNTIKEFMKDDDVVMVYDATHPLVDEEGIESVIEAIKDYGAATLAEYQYDTTYRINPETDIVEEVVPRKELIAGASPEGFKFGIAYKIFAETDPEKLDSMTSAGAMAVAFDIPFKAVPMKNAVNLKITYKNDMEIFKRIAKNYYD